MTPLQLIAILKDNLETRGEFNPVKRELKAPRKSKSYTHKFYDLSHLNALTSELAKLNDGYEDDEKYSVRYLVDTEARMIFAREGRPGSKIPGHKQIAGSCIAAGNVFFNKDYSKIIKINHDSGDFHPSIASLVHSLSILLAVVPDLLSDTVAIDVRENEKSKKETITLEKQALLKCLAGNLELASLANSAWDAIRIESNSSHKRRKPASEFSPSQRRRISSTVSSSSSSSTLNFDDAALQTQSLLFSTPPSSPKREKPQASAVSSSSSSSTLNFDDAALQTQSLLFFSEASPLKHEYPQQASVSSSSSSTLNFDDAALRPLDSLFSTSSTSPKSEKPSENIFSLS